MKHINAKRLFCLLALLAACLLAAGISCAETRKSGGFTYEILDDGTAKITKYSGTLGNTENVELIIPADLDQRLDQAALRARAEALAPRLGYSLQPLLDVLREAT